jgi:hypothetical protein
MLELRHLTSGCRASIQFPESMNASEQRWSEHPILEYDSAIQGGEYFLDAQARN